MANSHHPAVRVVERGRDDAAGGDRDDRRAWRRGVVHALMRSRGVQHGMHAPGRKARRHLWHELQWRAQEESPQRASLLVVVIRLAARRGEAEGMEDAPVVLEARGGHDAVRVRTTLAVEALEADGVPISWLEIVVEVDLSSKHLGHRDGEIDAFTSRLD